MKTLEEKPLKAPPLTLKSAPWGVMRFTHKDGKRHEFYSVINEMTGNRMSAFDGDAPGVGDPMPWVKSVFRDIQSKASDVEFIGTIKFQKGGRA